MIKVFDNFLSKEEFNLIKSEITSSEFAWYYQEGKVFPNDNLPSLTHSIFSENIIRSKLYNLILPIINKNDMKALVRIKANFDLKNNKSFKTNLHTDIQNNFENCKTGIFYINDNNGGTYFENKKLIKSVANRFILFPANMKHGTQTHTNTNYRIVINFNWY